MVIVLLFSLILILSIFSIRFSTENNHIKILDKDYTTQIRGIAIMFVMLSHCIIFLYFYPPINSQILFYEKVLQWFLALFTNIGVGIFLFLSGYGNYVSIQRTNTNLWMLKRALTLYVPTAVLLLIPFVLSFYNNTYSNVFSHWYSLIQKFFLMTFSFGVAWYVKVQFLMYILLFICFRLLNKKNYDSFYLTIIVSTYIIISIIFKIPAMWYMTSLCFPLGVLCSKYSKEIMSFLTKHILKKQLLLLVLIVPLCLGAYLYSYGIFMIFISLLSCLLIMFLSVNITLKSNILRFWGAQSLYLYLYLIHGEFIFFFRNFFAGKINVEICILVTIFLSIILVIPYSKICNLFINSITKKLSSLTNKFDTRRNC